MKKSEGFCYMLAVEINVLKVCCGILVWIMGQNFLQGKDRDTDVEDRHVDLEVGGRGMG